MEEESLYAQIVGILLMQMNSKIGSRALVYVLDAMLQYRQVIKEIRK
jgi:hypothetical protein